MRKRLERGIEKREEEQAKEEDQLDDNAQP